MAITSSTLTGLKAGIVAVLQTVSGLNVHDHEPKTVDPLPAAAVSWDGHERQTINLPSGGEDTGIRTESMFGGVDLVTRWVIRFYVDQGGRDRQTIETDIEQLVGSAIGAFDANETLPGQTSGGQVESCSLAASQGPLPLDPDGTDRATVYVECRLDVLSFH